LLENPVSGATMCSHGSDSCSGSQQLVSRVKVVYEFILSQPRRQTLISLSYHGSCTSMWRRRQATWLFTTPLSVHFWFSISLTFLNIVRTYDCEFSSFKWLL